MDHVVPLKWDDTDKPENMQWQTAGAAKAKDKSITSSCGLSRSAIKVSGSWALSSEFDRVGFPYLKFALQLC
jgi:hypothetical protein